MEASTAMQWVRKRERKKERRKKAREWVIRDGMDGEIEKGFGYNGVVGRAVSF